MNAQEEWKRRYNMFRHATLKGYATAYRNVMIRFRREAALERKLEAAQRQLEQAQHVIEALELFNMVEWAEAPRRDEAQGISREHAAMIDALQGELNAALARIAELEAILVSYG